MANEKIKTESGDADKYATIGLRAAAVIVDLVLIFIIALLASIILTKLFGDFGGTVAVLLWFFGYFAYFILFEGGFGKGQTVGKRLLHIKVIKKEGGVPSYIQSFIRTFTRFFDLLINHLVGLICALITEKRQRIGDLLANTIVVKEYVESPPKSNADKKSVFVAILIAFAVVLTVIMIMILGIVLWHWASSAAVEPLI